MYLLLGPIYTQIMIVNKFKGDIAIGSFLSIESNLIRLGGLVHRIQNS